MDIACKMAYVIGLQEHVIFAEVMSALCRDDFSWREDGVIMIKADTGKDGCKFV